MRLSRSMKNDQALHSDGQKYCTRVVQPRPKRPNLMSFTLRLEATYAGQGAPTVRADSESRSCELSHYMVDFFLNIKSIISKLRVVICPRYEMQLL